MGKGTEHKKDWKPTTLQVVVDAKRLYYHSAKIMSNEKVFNPKNDFHGTTLIRINELLLDVYTKTWEANHINASKEPHLVGERLALQRHAIVSTRLLLSLFELAKSQFHLDSRKFWNWMNMLVELGKKLSAWHKSDIERYGSQSSLSNQDGRRLQSLGGEPPSAVC